MATNIAPVCRCCGRPFKPGHFWYRANLCRAAHIVSFLQEHPGQSAWELSQELGMTYSDVQKGLMRAREYGLVTYTTEEREAGGVRHRYSVAPGWEEVIAEWAEKGWI
jgi:predicted transcriptional regulator